MSELIQQLNGLIGKSSTKEDPSYYTKLEDVLKTTGADLEGYVSWVAEKYGVINLRRKLIESKVIEDFVQATRAERAAFPQHILNAGTIFSNISKSGLLDSNVLERLMDMTMPHALYFLFASVGTDIKVLRSTARKYALTFPSAIRQLPEEYIEVARKLVGEENDTSGSS